MTNEMIIRASKEYQTPAYIFDTDMLKERLAMIQTTLGDDIILCYAMKANPFLLGAMNDLVTRFEVCSPGEFRICERNNIDMKRIVLSGVNKEEAEIIRIVKAYGNDITYTVESLEHLRILDACATARQLKLTILLRVTSGNQFGVSTDCIEEIIKNRNNYPFLDFHGLQFYSGTQKKGLGKINEELHTLDEFCTHLSKQYDFTVKELEYGPGFYVPYFANEEDTDDVALLKDFRQTLDSLNFSGQITLEMGRFMVAYCGYFMTSIVDYKENNGQAYCIIDGGIHHLNYYGQTMAMKLPHFSKFPDSPSAKAKPYTICGSLCTTADVLVKQLPLKNIQIYDILVFKRLGAYSVTEGIYLFLSRDLPQIIFFSEAAGFQLMRSNLPTDILNNPN
jgi:Diaminopimelate decarboxylase